MKKEEILIKLKKLNLPIGEYAVFGSGPIAIRNLRESSDIDIITTIELFETLKKKHKNLLSHTKNGDEKINFDDIEIFHNWRDIDVNINELIKNADIIKGYPFVKLEHVIRWKKNRGKEKDLKDIDLIKSFLNKN